MLQKTDPTIYKLIKQELKRQQQGIEMIPSENYASEAVIEALGSVLTNKYSEGYPKRRYYGGQEYIDEIEQIAIDRAKALFSAEHANVQPLSGAPANIAAYSALLNPKDTILGMDLSHGGHLTHGHPVTLAAKIYNFIHYSCDPKTGEFDFKNIRKIAQKHKPKLILVGYSAYSREIDYQKFKEIADEIGAYTMMDIAHIAGLIAGGIMNNPTPLFDVVTSTTHKTLRGPRGGLILCKNDLQKQVDKAVFPGLQGGPHENNIAAKAVAFHEAAQPEFKEYGKQVLKNAKVLEQEFKAANFEICFGGTNNHLLLIDLRNKNITGAKAESVLDEVGITINKNVIPNDPRPPLDPSGIRIGTPAITTRGIKEKETKQIAQIMIETLLAPNDKEKKRKNREKIRELCLKFSIYNGLLQNNNHIKQ